MNETCNKHYDDEYYQSHLGVEDYNNNLEIIAFNKNIAKEINVFFHPKKVLDVGCACGHLVKAMRDIGIQAYGIDGSDYAIANVHPEIKSFCYCQKLPLEILPKEIPDKFDLLTNIEILEHIEEKEARNCVKNLTQLSDTIIFSSTPIDFEEETHINVQPICYWVKLFSEQGYYPDLSYDLTYLTPQAILFRKNFVPSFETLLPAFDVLFLQKQQITELTNLAVDRLNIIKEERLLIENLNKELTSIKNTKFYKIHKILKKILHFDINLQKRN